VGYRVKCKINKTMRGDIAAWVSRDIFMANVDQKDLSCRDSQVVFDWYHPNWFHRNADGILCFTPPAFEFRGGYLRGINGRHRAILLFRHIDAIPMLLVCTNWWPKGKLAEIALKQIEEGEDIQLPDLPINQILQE
jgi:hypothetical protein